MRRARGEREDYRVDVVRACWRLGSLQLGDEPRFQAAVTLLRDGLSTGESG